MPPHHTKAKGQKIKNTDHSRDKGSAIEEMMVDLCRKFENPEQARQFLKGIRHAKPRYIRDQMLILRDAVEKTPASILSKSLEYCCDHEIVGAADNGLSINRFNQLRELNWLDQVYNLILMGPSGTGKTFLAAGLCADAVHRGYKAYFRTMEEIMTMLALKDITRSASADYKRLTYAQLIAIDDIMLFPIEKNQAELAPMRTHWYRGGFPEAYLAPDDDFARRWMTQFFTTFIERDLSIVIGREVNRPDMLRLLRMLGHFAWADSECSAAFRRPQPIRTNRQ